MERALHRPMKHFDLDHQHRFAALSGDLNPLHLDPVLSRRLLFGGPVVHGVHLVLCALEETLLHVPGPRVLAELKGVFRRPLPLETATSLEVGQADEQGFHARLRGGHCDLSGRFAAPADVAAWQVDPADPALPGACRELTFREATAAEGNIALSLDRDALRRMFPQVARCLPAIQVAVVLATTRLTGMICPGLHTVFDSLELRFAARPGPPVLEYRVDRSDARFSAVTLVVSGGGVEGRLHTFFRPPPVAQPSCAEVAAVVEPEEFRLQRALVVGGSRGLGELTAKIVAAGGGTVRITYCRGEEDARRVAEAIGDAGHGTCTAWPFDVTSPLGDALARELRSWAPTHVYYFATPHVASVCRCEGFSAAAFRRLCAFYVEGFAALVDSLTSSRESPLSLFYPSSEQVNAPERGAAEYAAAKAAGEVLCAALSKRPGVARVRAPRLPRMETDQTASIGPQRYADRLEVMLREIRRLECSLTDE